MDEQDTGTDHLTEIWKPKSLMDGGKVTDQVMRRRSRQSGARWWESPDG